MRFYQICTTNLYWKYLFNVWCDTFKGKFDNFEGVIDSDRYFYQIYKKFDIPHFLFVSHVNIHFNILCAPGLKYSF